MTTAKFIVKGRKALQLQEACANPRECARVHNSCDELINQGLASRIAPLAVQRVQGFWVRDDVFTENNSAFLKPLLTGTLGMPRLLAQNYPFLYFFNYGVILFLHNYTYIKYMENVLVYK